MTTVIGKKEKRKTGADFPWMILSTATYKFIGLYDDTKIYANGTLVGTVNQQQVSNISLNANDIITSNKAISFTRSGSGQTGISYAWKGISFAHNVTRYTVSFYIVATDQDATVTIEKNGASHFSGTVSTTSYTTVTANGNGTFVINSDYPIAVYAGSLPSQDCLPLYPATTELFGTASSDGFIIATENGTSITEYSTSGATRTFTLNRGAVSTFSYTGGNQFTGQSVRLVADKPVAAESQADADGGEMTPFVGTDAFGLRFAIPGNKNQFVKLVGNTAANVEIYNSSGTLLQTVTLTGSAANGVYNAYPTNASATQGVLLVSDQPVSAIYEGEADDETILFSHYPKTEAGSVAYNPHIVTDGLVLALDAANPKSYPGSGTTWFDLSGSGNNGTLTNGPIYSSNNNGYLQFDGVDDTVSIGTGSVYGTGAMSVEIWCNSNTNEDSIITRGSSRNSTSSRELDIYGNGSLLSFLLSNKINVNVISTNFPSLNVWHQITCVWDGTTNADGMKIYIDGVLETGATATSNITTTSETLNLYIAGDPFRTYEFNGEIANVKFYNRALISSEVLQNFNALKGRYGL